MILYSCLLLLWTYIIHSIFMKQKISNMHERDQCIFFFYSYSIIFVYFFTMIMGRGGGYFGELEWIKGTGRGSFFFNLNQCCEAKQFLSGSGSSVVPKRGKPPNCGKPLNKIRKYMKKRWNKSTDLLRIYNFWEN